MQKIINELSNRYTFEGHFSKIPIYWEAEEAQSIIRQIDKSGDIANRWQDLNPDHLTYWGLVGVHGRCGFYPQQGVMVINDSKISLGQKYPTSDGTNVIVKPLSGSILYRRRIVGDGTGAEQTWLSEILFGRHCLTVKLIPNYEIIYSYIEKGENTVDI